MVTQRLRIGVNNMIEPYNKIVDMCDKSCRNDCGGVYKDLLIVDNLEGKLHCIVCHERIDRYVTIEEETQMAKKGDKKK